MAIRLLRTHHVVQDDSAWNGTPVLNRLAARIAAVAAVAAVVLMGIPAKSAVAGTADAPSCTARYTCLFQSGGWGGTEQDYYNPTAGSSWVNIPMDERASVVTGGASDVWYWNRQAGLYTCVPGNSSDADLAFPGGAGDPGYMFIAYGVTQNCSEAHPADAPGS